MCALKIRSEFTNSGFAFENLQVILKSVFKMMNYNFEKKELS